jgi:hypothetical protein
MNTAPKVRIFLPSPPWEFVWQPERGANGFEFMTRHPKFSTPGGGRGEGAALLAHCLVLGHGAPQTGQVKGRAVQGHFGSRLGQSSQLAP